MLRQRPARMALGAVALGLLVACAASPAMTVEEARSMIAEEVPALLEALVGERRSAPTEVVVLDCTAGPGQRRAERYARVTALHDDDDPDALADAAQAHLEGRGAEITALERLPDAPRVQARMEGIRYELLVDTGARRIIAAGTTGCYAMQDVSPP